MIRSVAISAAIISTCCATTTTPNRLALSDGYKRCVVVQAVTDHKTCSGVILRTNTILTARHCLGEGMQVNGKAALVKKVGANETIDLALLHAETPEFPELEIAADPYVGDRAYSFANYGPWAALYSDGEVMRVDADRTYVRVLSAPGVSGAAVYDQNGRLLGIAVQYSVTVFDTPAGMGSSILFGSAVPASKIRQFIKEP